MLGYSDGISAAEALMEEEMDKVYALSNASDDGTARCVYSAVYGVLYMLSRRLEAERLGQPSESSRS